MTSEEFASKMIEDFEEIKPPEEVIDIKEEAKKIEESINQKIEEEVKKRLQEEPIVEDDKKINDSEFENEENNLNDESEEE